MADHPNYIELVRAIRADVVNAGIDLGHGPGECGRFEVTKRVAYHLNVTKGEDVGLIAKFGAQNQCSEGVPEGADESGYAVDAIMFRDGTVVDILGNGADGPNTAQWVVSTGNPSLWRPPFGVPDETQPPPPPPQPPEPGTPDLAARLADLEHAVAVLEKKMIDKSVGFDLRLAALESRPFYTHAEVDLLGLKLTGKLYT